MIAGPTPPAPGPSRAGEESPAEVVPGGRVRTRRRLILEILQHLGIFFLLWQVGAGLALFLLAPPLGILVALLLAGVLLYGHALRRGQPGEIRRWAVLRLRPLRRPVALWTLAAIPVLLATSWALSEVYAGLVTIPPETLNPYAPLTRTAAGRLSLAVAAVVIAPLLEEFFFRGLIQRPLERRWGAARAILFTGALFAAIHLLPWILPLHLFLGLAFGWIVYATRSIWPGVMLHAANNAAALLGLEGTQDPTARPTIWDAGPDLDWWSALVLLVVGLAAGFWVARRLWRAARG